MSGIFGTSATLFSDLSLIMIVCLGIVATFGAIQIRQQRTSRHCLTMAIATALNWIPVGLIMLPVWRDIASGDKSLVAGAITTIVVIHGILGGSTQLLMTYTVIRMYWLQNLPPKKTRWLMKTTISLWMLTILGGIGVYWGLYIH